MKRPAVPIILLVLALACAKAPLPSQGTQLPVHDAVATSPNVSPAEPTAIGHRGAAEGGASESPATSTEHPEKIGFTAKTRLSKCIGVRPLRTTSLDNLLLGVVRISGERSVGACGCPSKAVRFYSYLQDGSHESMQAIGDLVAPDPGTALDRRILLLEDRSYFAQPKLRVEIECTPPS